MICYEHECSNLSVSIVDCMNTDPVCDSTLVHIDLNTDSATSL